jgi:putative ABC transport system permease protein
MREDFKPTVFFPEQQDPHTSPLGHIVLHSRLPLETLVPAIKQKFSDVNPAIWLRFKVLNTQIEESLLRERLMATLSGFFGGLAVVLAVIGLYGVIAYMVARRRGEIGIRMALGADRGRVVALVLREAAWLLMLGLAAGALLALALARTASSLLFGVKPDDPPTFLAALAALAVVALIATLVPARRAAALDPMTALRDE